MEAVKQKQIVLTSTLKEVEEKLKYLNVEKKFLEDRLNKLEQKIGVTQKQGLELGERISNLMKKEIELEQQRKETRNNLKMINQKLKKLKDLDKKLKV